MASQTVASNSNERTLAGLAHASVLLGAFTNGVGGTIAALLIWATQREKSAYAAWQALQAAVYQLLGIAVFSITWCCWLVFYFATWIPLFASIEQDPDVLPPIFWVGLGSMIIPLAIMGLWTLYGLWGAVQAFQGKPFRYAFVGSWVERYLNTESKASQAKPLV